MGICTDIDIGIVYTGKQGIFRRKGVVYKYSTVYESNMNNKCSNMYMLSYSYGLYAYVERYRVDSYRNIAGIIR